MRRSFVPFSLAAGLYLLLTVALTWPLVLHPASRVPNDLGDSLLNMFLLAWDAREVPLSERWWNLPQFYPVPGVMAFSEHLLGLTVITTPIIAATGNVLLAYNAAFFLSFPLCALFAHLLAFELTRRHDVSVVAGIAYGFAPYRMAQFAHVQVLSAYWIPLVLLGLHLFLRRPQWRWAALFAVAWLMQALACGYYLFYLSVLVGLWLLWFAVGRTRWIDLGRLLGMWAIAVLAMVPVALGYLEYQRAYGFRRWPEEIQAFSADVASLLTAPGNLRLWGWLKVIQHPESDLFPGLGIVVLIATGVIVAWAAAARSGVQRLRTLRIMMTMAIVAAFVAATPGWLGPWRLEIFGIRLLSVSSSLKPLSVAILLAVVAMAMHPSIRIAWRHRSPLAFYTIAAAVMWLFSLGPAPTLMDKPFLYKAPYSWLMLVPGVDGVRVPARFWTLATMCMATAAALAIAHVGGRWRSIRPMLPVVAGAVMLVESWPRPLSLELVPSPRPAYARAAARLDLPFSAGHDLIALYRAIEHRRPLVNGYSGYFAPHYGSLQYLLEQHDPMVLAHLTSLGPLEVVVDHDQDPSGEWRAYIGGQPEAEVDNRSDVATTFRLPRRRGTYAPPEFSGHTLPISSVVASRFPDLVGNMTDGDRITRWHTGGPQDPGAQVTVDLGTVRQVEGLETQLSGYVADFPRELTIEASDDGVAWRQIWSGPTAFAAYLAALEDPLLVPLRIAVPSSQARFVRLTQTSRDPVYYWTIAELRIYGR
jgi:F5/8 type C domain